jgi:hypothetical protein
MEKEKLDLIKSKLEEVKGLINEIEEVIKVEESSLRKSVLARHSFAELEKIYVELQELKRKGESEKIKSMIKELGLDISKTK